MSKNTNQGTTTETTTETEQAAGTAAEAEQAAAATEAAATTETTTEAATQGAGDPETFPREYVVKLRQESAGHRDRAKRADDYAQKLHAALVKSSGRLQDPTDLPFDEKHLESEEALEAAVTDLLARKPHLASRVPSGDIGQGHQGAGDSAPVSLAGLLRANAG